MTSKKAYVGAILSDIHAGAFEAKQWYHELEEGFLTHIGKLAILDFVILSGDYFHTKISANSEHARYALRFLTKLIRICAEKDAKLRIIKGTESHDNKQLEMFDGLQTAAQCDFKVIHTVASEYLFEDLRVLYIPEEYMEDMDEFYGEYFSETYDYVIGHGLVDKAVFIAATQESEQTMSKAPIFKTDILHHICRGPIYFGHIHKPMKVDRFRYVGSYSRWAFGEEEDKGFIMTYYTPETGKFKDEFIVNDHARKFETIKVEYSSPMFNRTQQEQIEYLIQITDTLMTDYLRLEINIPEDYENPMLLTNMLNEVFNKFKNVKLKINNNSKTRQKKEVEEKINALIERYGYIFDKTKSAEEKISKFIKTKHNRDISTEKVRFYLYENILNREEK